MTDAVRMMPAEDPLAAERDALFDAAPHAALLLDHRGCIEAANEACARLFGYVTAALRGQSLRVLVPGFSTPETLTGADTGRTSDGRTLQISVRVVRIGESSPARFVVFIEDVTHARQAATERSTYEQAVERTQLLHERLTRVSRMATLGEMAAGIAHEINQPLTAIASYAQACDWLLSNGTTNLEEVRNALRQIEAQGLRAGQIIHRLRSLARQPEDAPVPTDLNELVGEINSLAVTDARVNDVTLQFELAPDLPPVLADRVRIQQVLLNLVRNAIEALADMPSDRRNVLIRTARTPSGELEIRVSDSGPGVAESIRGRLFDPFVTSKPGGSGLGLAVSRSIVEAHKGTLRYEPAAAGASFVVRLPSAQG